MNYDEVLKAGLMRPGYYLPDQSHNLIRVKDIRLYGKGNYPDALKLQIVLDQSIAIIWKTLLGSLLIRSFIKN